MARQYEVKGTKSFLYWALGLTFLAVWAIRDAWFMTQSKALDKVEYVMTHESLGKDSDELHEVLAEVKKRVSARIDTPWYIPNSHMREITLEVSKEGLEEDWMPGDNVSTLKAIDTKTHNFVHFNVTLTIISVVAGLGCYFMHFFGR